MAKRRNPKREKALRNQAYARKFRKRSNNRYGRRFSNTNKSDSDKSDQESEDTQDASASASD
ncbi:hypothetical protein [Lyngbya confervoides]|uniref:Uncharacterized protein n=1 Tax=Lyngbya confervoides BDU141951 TaxID=1574623 RepID=A0ABD4T936_9CYAN|nr:hypothetical protein [Lyngbya confervoides]MCM1985087.1 hypothetical protein [Lyngbya confervoides BDU141951]